MDNISKSKQWYVAIDIFQTVYSMDDIQITKQYILCCTIKSTTKTLD